MRGSPTPHAMTDKDGAARETDRQRIVGQRCAARLDMTGASRHVQLAAAAPLEGETMEEGQRRAVEFIPARLSAAPGAARSDEEIERRPAAVGQQQDAVDLLRGAVSCGEGGDAPRAVDRG